MNSRLRKVVAGVEIAGGLLGPVAIILTIGRKDLPTQHLAVVAFGFCYFLLSLYAGVMLWRDRRSGYIASVFVQLVQLPKYASTLFVFLVSGGVDLWLTLESQPWGAGIERRGVRVGGHVGGVFLVASDPQPPLLKQMLGISLISLASLWALRDRQSASTTAATSTEMLQGPSHLRDRVASIGAVQDQLIASPQPPDWVMPRRLIVLCLLFIVIAATCAGVIAMNR